MAEQVAFTVYQPGDNPELAFLAAVGAARADHGYSGYSGNIGEKLRDGYSIVEPNPVPYKHALQMADRIIGAGMTIVQPYGPVCAIACADGPGSSGARAAGPAGGPSGWLFIGRAPLTSDVGADQVHITRTLMGMPADPRALIRDEDHADG